MFFLLLALSRLQFPEGTPLIKYKYAQPGMADANVAAVSATLCCFIDLAVLVERLRNAHGLQAAIDGSAVPYVALRSCSACQHVVLGPADSSLKGAEPPAGAICIPDKAIHHPHHSAQFGLLHQTAFGRRRRAFTCTCL